MHGVVATVGNASRRPRHIVSQLPPEIGVGLRYHITCVEDQQVNVAV